MAPPSPTGFCVLQGYSIPFSQTVEKELDIGLLYYTSFFSTVYNILLCLHIFSVHIIHQSKKRNYDSLEQLSYDSKRGPKVYLHGQCTPPTNLTSKMMNLATGTRKN